MWEKLNMSSWKDILNRHRPRATSYYNPLNREWVEPSHVGYYRQYYSPHPETHSVVFSTDYFELQARIEDEIKAKWFHS